MYYKAFEKGMICMEKQYQENAVYEEMGGRICDEGMMHFCERLFDTLDYYPLVDGDGDLSEFAEVEPLGDVVKEDNKCATKKIRIGQKLSFYEFVRISANDLILMEKPKKSFWFYPATDDNGKKEVRIHNSEKKRNLNSSGNKAKISSSGYCCFINSSGEGAKIGNSGSDTQICSVGACAEIGNSGNCAQISSLGDDAKISNYGDGVEISSFGEGTLICNSGDRVRILSSGDDNREIGNIGADVKISNSANVVRICNYGESAQIDNSGDSVLIRNFGDEARIVSTGDCVKIKMEGHGNVVVAIGYDSAISGKVGDFITLAEDGDFAVGDVKSARIDGEKLKEDVFYTLSNGEFVECID